MKALEFIDDWMFRAYDPCARSLPYFRILFSAYLLVFTLPLYAWVGDMPSFFFHPPFSLAMFFSRLPPPCFFFSLDFVLELAALCLLLGRHTRLASLTLCLGLIVGNSFRYSIGTKIDHDILIPATLFCLSFSGWGARVSWDEQRLSRAERHHSPSWPIALLMLIVGFCMLTAAIPKAASGWLSPQLEACRGQLISNYLENFRPTWVTDTLLQIHSHLFWKMADWSTLVIEGGFIFCIFSLPAIRFLACCAVFFHAFVFFSMDILFSFNLAAYACLLDLRVLLRKAWIRRTVGHFRRLAHAAPLYLLVPAAFALTVGFYQLHAL
jgi:hypothetical protein